MAGKRNRNSSGTPSAGQDASAAAPGRTGQPGQPGQAGQAGQPGQPGRARPPETAPDLRVQMPYFLARIAVLVILTVVLVVVNVPLLLALLIGFAAAGLATWPIGRMQRRAAARSRAADTPPKAPGP